MSSGISSSRSLHRLIYFSRQNFPDADLDVEIASMLAASVRNNRRDEITGLLLTHQGWFLQALEGPANAVQHTLGRIGQDRRHKEVHIITAGPAERREFAAWNMCARKLTAADDAILATLDQRGVFDPAKLNGATALKLLSLVKGIRHDIAARLAPLRA